MTMEKLPKADMILAGFLAQVSLTWIIRIATGTFEDYYIRPAVEGWYFSDFCRLNGIPWLLLILISAGVTVITVLKSEGDKVFQAIVTFVSSFLINCGGEGLGYMAIHCSKYVMEFSDRTWVTILIDSWDEMRPILSYIFLPVMALASLGMVAHLIKSTPQSTKLPDPEVILLGICLQLSAENCIRLSGSGYRNFCETGGIGSWLLLLALSYILSVLSVITTTESFRVSRLFGTFIGTFLIHLMQEGVGKRAVVCASNNAVFSEPSSRKAYGIVCIVFNALLALAVTVLFMTKQRASPNQIPVTQNATVIVGPHTTATSYPMKDIGPSENNSNQASYPPP